MASLHRNDYIEDYLTADDSLLITGGHLLARDLFRFLLGQKKLTSEPLYLSTDLGLIIDIFPRDDTCAELIGRTLNSSSADGFSAWTYAAADYRIISPEFDAADLADELTALLTIFERDEHNSRRLLNWLNAVKPSISFYDKDATLLFANHSFCRDLSISDPEAAIGRTVDSIIKTAGIKIHSMDDNSTHLKMMDVLSKGEEAIDWEVRIESVDNPEEYKMVSNDMYPVMDEEGKVSGMIELTHSRKQDIKRTRKIMGLAAEYTFEDILGSSKVIKEKIRTAKEYANSPFNFLITGESGVGKELFAQSIHNYSPRQKGPFVALNCANFSDGLIESELFGYVGGAFTGASKNGQIGKFELADGGTLFLDEIGELPLHFQSKLLRVLETWMVTRIGSSKQIPVNVRLIAATNRNLAEMVEEGLFRQDLYYRLQVLTVEIPPLRERKEDVLLLSEAFLNQAAAPYMDTPKILDAEAREVLTAYDWPGNVRELRNVINRATILSKSRIITKDVLAESIMSKGYFLKNSSTEKPEDRLSKRMHEIDNAYVNLINEALDISGGNKKEAAELIGVSRKTFYRMLEKYQV